MEIADFDGISYGGVSEIIQSYLTNRSENRIEFFREHCSWSDLSIFELISGMASPGGIMALSRRGMPRTRTSILSGVTVHQACNKASRNLATVVGGLSTTPVNSPI